MASITDDAKVTPARAASDFSSKTVAPPTTETFRNTGRELLLVVNTGGAAATLTITIARTVDLCVVDDKVLTIAAGTSHLIGAFPTEIYNDEDGEVAIAFSGDGAPDIELTVILP